MQLEFPFQIGPKLRAGKCSDLFLLRALLLLLLLLLLIVSQIQSPALAVQLVSVCCALVNFCALFSFIFKM